MIKLLLFMVTLYSCGKPLKDRESMPQNNMPDPIINVVDSPNAQNESINDSSHEVDDSLGQDNGTSINENKDELEQAIDNLTFELIQIADEIANESRLYKKDKLLKKFIKKEKKLDKLKKKCKNVSKGTQQRGKNGKNTSSRDNKQKKTRKQK